MSSEFHFDAEEAALLNEIEAGEWQAKPMTTDEKQQLSQYAAYSKSLQEKRQTTIRFSVSDLAAVKAKSKELGISYQNIIQALVHHYATGKIKLEL